MQLRVPIEKFMTKINVLEIPWGVWDVVLV
jgi:hypothetical protein